MAATNAILESLRFDSATHRDAPKSLRVNLSLLKQSFCRGDGNHEATLIAGLKHFAAAIRFNTDPSLYKEIENSIDKSSAVVEWKEFLGSSPLVANFSRRLTIAKVLESLQAVIVDAIILPAEDPQWTDPGKIAELTAAIGEAAAGKWNLEAVPFC